MIALAQTRRVTTDGRWVCRLIGACIALFAGSALFGQQAQFQGSVPPE